MVVSHDRQHVYLGPLPEPAHRQLSCGRFSGVTVTYLRPRGWPRPCLCTVTLSPTRNFSSRLVIAHRSKAMRPGKPLWDGDHHVAPLVVGGVDTAFAHLADNTGSASAPFASINSSPTLISESS